MADTEIPQDNSGVEPETGRFIPAWVHFFAAIARRMRGISSTATITQTDVGAAPGAYSQAHSENLRTMVNSLKASVNDIITKAG